MTSNSAYAQLRLGLTYSIPVVIALGLIIVAQANQDTGKPIVWKGVKSMFSGKWDKFLNGDGYVAPQPQPQVFAMELDSVSELVEALPDTEVVVKKENLRKVRHE